MHAGPISTNPRSGQDALKGRLSGKMVTAHRSPLVGDGSDAARSVLSAPAGWHSATKALGVLVMATSCSLTGHAQVATPTTERICRSLVSTDRGFPQYKSCCDVDGGHSRWVKADGGAETRVSVCALWGIKPGPPALDLAGPERPVTPKLSEQGIPPGSYRCALSVGQPPTITLQPGGRYSVSDGSAGTFELAERASDGIGGFARYRIAGGSFDGFFFLHRDNGQLQVGRNGWARCMPL